ncbi:MAG: hypothetical protein M1829_003211 [Trizodia sp. TS-e1964]|nr:MAG: hypothetical protein M1829_003211 [Trizodia sp. TS-e1964]
MRIPYSSPGALPAARAVPHYASDFAGAITALSNFLTISSSGQNAVPSSTVILSGAGLSVASGLADYRGQNGTYTQNTTYRPIFYEEFCRNHEARKRYWARSFLGWTTLDKSKPNAAHWAVKALGDIGIVKEVVTQNVDSFHSIAHPNIPTVELHGYLRSVRCLSCHRHFPRTDFQQSLSSLNPSWATFLAGVLLSGALHTENPQDRLAKGLKTNPDGDVDLPDAPYSTFRYPPCPSCHANPPKDENGLRSRIDVDADGAWIAGNTAGVLKPAVVMFGESIPNDVKLAAENAVDNSGRLLVIGSSLATYSAWRLVMRAKERGKPIGILNLGGVRGEEAFVDYMNEDSRQDGSTGVRAEQRADVLLPELVKKLQIGLRKLPEIRESSTAAAGSQRRSNCVA